MAKILHTSDLHVVRPAVDAQLSSSRRCIPKLAPDAVVISEELNRRYSNPEFVCARPYSTTSERPPRHRHGDPDIRSIGVATSNLPGADKIHRKFIRNSSPIHCHLLYSEVRCVLRCTRSNVSGKRRRS